MWILFIFALCTRYGLADNVDVNLICREESKMSYFFKGLDFVCAEGACTRKDKLCDRIAATVEPCVLPPYPQNGNYSTPRDPSLTPGQKVDSVIMNYNCDTDYNVVGESVVHCVTGRWSGPTPVCARLCELVKNPNVIYRCLINGDERLGSRVCGQWEPSGTVVQPECKTRDIFSSGPLSPMRCISGRWDNIASCVSECGRLPEVQQYGAGDVPVPWHASIFSKEKDPYQLVAGGSIIATTVVLSAARSFFSEDSNLQQPVNHAVAVGQLRRNWEDLKDNVQRAEVKEIKVSGRYKGATGFFGSDVALVLLTMPITFNQFVSPICLDNDVNFEKTQVQVGNLGMVASWKPNGLDGLSSGLKPIQMTVESLATCGELNSYPRSGKFCIAPWSNVTYQEVCNIDYGSGVAFPVNNEGPKYYLRGHVAITSAPRDPCPRHIGATRIIKNMAYIKSNLMLS